MRKDMNVDKCPHCVKKIIGGCRAILTHSRNMCDKPAVDFVEFDDIGEKAQFPVCKKHLEMFNRQQSCKKLRKPMYFKRYSAVSDYSDGWA